MAKAKLINASCTRLSTEDYKAVKELRKSSEPSLTLRFLQGPPGPAKPTKKRRSAEYRSLGNHRCHRRRGPCEVSGMDNLRFRSCRARSLYRLAETLIPDEEDRIPFARICGLARKIWRPHLP